MRLADLAGLSRPYVQNLETASAPRGRAPSKPSVETLSKLAAGLATDADGVVVTDKQGDYHRLLMDAGFMVGRSESTRENRPHQPRAWTRGSAGDAPVWDLLFRAAHEWRDLSRDAQRILAAALEAALARHEGEGSAAAYEGQ